MRLYKKELKIRSTRSLGIRTYLLNLLLLWRTLRGKIPTNQKPSYIVFDPTNNVCCCNRRGMENIEQIFNSGKFAAYVWRSFATTTRIHTNHSSLQKLTMEPKKQTLSGSIILFTNTNCLLQSTTFPHIRWPANQKDLIQLCENCVHDTK